MRGECAVGGWGGAGGGEGGAGASGEAGPAGVVGLLLRARGRCLGGGPRDRVVPAGAGAGEAAPPRRQRRCGGGRAVGADVVSDGGHGEAGRDLPVMSVGRVVRFTR